MRVLLASRNKKKLAELNRVLAAADVHGIELVSLADVDEYPETPETGATFVDNARIKTRDGVRHAGLPTIADDSGIAVDALNGMPGVLSARWSGGHGDDAANNELLLGQLADVPEERRGAHYVSACVLQLPEDVAATAGLDTEYAVEGAWHGTILRAPQGEGGFGYDPLFQPAETPGRSAAELSPEEKDALSHRGKALQQLVEPLRALAGV
ncbi:MAG TPA: non-canonical purine NTP pyrophosphatase [Candidatus Corynebacterium gallistercoris]|uniref:dITP/XTP pyrophosphatase n=1 Tax=Candidatus Corynebacterium gallistercoris TaxID=2838530 RepID=A0A9D1S0F2_9CORY|nr:non-canonical purine NTP pyrophosphatase [Candidatus Corynebacterium gallistercoris]